MVLTGIALVLCSQDPLTESFQAGRYDAVTRSARLSIEAGDTAYNTYYLKSLAESQLGRTEQAIETLEAALRHHDQD